MADEKIGLEALGAGFREYQEGMRKKRWRPQLADSAKAEIIDLVKSDMKPETAILPYSAGGKGPNYSALLVEVPRNMGRYAKFMEKTGNYRVAVLWKGVWMSVFLDQRELNKLEAGNYCILVGFFKEGIWNDRPQFTLSLAGGGVITMQEISRLEVEKNIVIPDEDIVLPVRFLQDVPAFVGADMKEYGPFKSGAIADVPVKIARLLFDRKLAEEIRND